MRLAASAAILGMTMGAAMPETKENQLFAAAGRGNATEIGTLISEGAKIDARNDLGETALLIATHANHVEEAKKLIEAGGDVNAKDKINGST